MSRNFKLSGEDVDNLITLVDSGGYSTLLKIINRFVENEREKVIQFNLDKGSFATLGMAKARCEGYMELARKLETEIKRLVASNTGGKNV